MAMLHSHRKLARVALCEL